MSSSEDVEALNWSQWLDFDKSNILTIPESAGVYKMHASMKVLYIGSANQNLRQTLLDCLSDPCISKARRFSYAITTTKSAADKVVNQLLDEYRSKHNNKLPVCMEGK
jgi:excinuclease UvrABC nuclease subunit